MDFTTDEPKAILSKSLVLAEKTSNRIGQIDHRHFPTDSSEIARQLLLDTLALLRDPRNVSPMDPCVLYQRLIYMQELYELVAQSSVDRILWPLVGYCDEFWKGFFGPDTPKIFYSVTQEHNYSIFPFSKYLARLLNGLLHPSLIRSLVDGRNIYCLQLASVEDENMPLYAIIGHEFGHAVFGQHEPELLRILGNHFVDVVREIHAFYANEDNTQTARRLLRTRFVIRRMAEELFCDMVGAMLMGPAFFMSSFEMSWGRSRDIFHISLAPDDFQIRAYPSDQFRLSCSKSLAGITEFCTTADKDFKKLMNPEDRNISSCLSTIPTEHDTDTVSIRPISDPDAGIIRAAVATKLNPIKEALRKFLEDSAAWFSTAFPNNLRNVSTSEICELVLRLEHEILPNVIPDDTLRGNPADFAAILNASALYRMQLLTNRRLDEDSLARSLGIVERLTAKAFEVSFIQRRFDEWSRNQE